MYMAPRTVHPGWEIWTWLPGTACRLATPSHLPRSAMIKLARTPTRLPSPSPFHPALFPRQIHPTARGPVNSPLCVYESKPKTGLDRDPRPTILFTTETRRAHKFLLPAHSRARLSGAASSANHHYLGRRQQTRCGNSGTRRADLSTTCNGPRGQCATDESSWWHSFGLRFPWTSFREETPRPFAKLHPTT